MARIPLFYRIFFLYIDPVICLSGIYLFFFDPHTFILNGVPSAITSQISPTSTIPPLTNYLIMSCGSYSLFVFAMQILLLHPFKDAPDGLNVRIWRTVQFGILLIDLGLLYGVYVADPKAALDVSGWGSGDWTNNGILGLVALIRSAFLLGIGRVQ
jgi:hypothetical protein